MNRRSYWNWNSLYEHVLNPVYVLMIWGIFEDVAVDVFFCLSQDSVPDFFFSEVCDCSTVFLFIKFDRTKPVGCQ